MNSKNSKVNTVSSVCSKSGLLIVNDSGSDASGGNNQSSYHSFNDNDRDIHEYLNPNNDDSRPYREVTQKLFVPSVLLTLSVVEIALNGIFYRQETTQSEEFYHEHYTSEYHTLVHKRSLISDGLPVVPDFHKSLYPLSASDYTGFACATLGLMIAGGGGIGGGGMLVPIYILIMEFSPKHAIPLANVTVFGGAVANTILNSVKRHPLANRPLVDWDLIMVMEPLTIGGALIGAFLNKLLPDELLVVFLVLLLSFTAKSTLQKAFKLYRKETEEMLKNQIVNKKVSDLSLLARQNKNDIVCGEMDALLDNRFGGVEKEEENNDTDADADAALETLGEDKGINQSKNNRILRKILDEESRTPIGNILVLFTMFIVVLLINIAKGGGALPSPVGIQCGSYAFWASNVIMLLWVIIISLFVRSNLVKRYELKKQISYPYVEGDIEWDSWATIKYPCMCCLAGFFAGMFGVGGGIVKGPLMLAMGVHPSVSSASSACMILFTSFTATTSFMVFGLVIPDYAPVCFAIGFVATLFGQVGLYYLMKKFNRNSFIAFSIGGVVLLSAILMTVQSLISIAEGTHHHTGGVCGDGED